MSGDDVSSLQQALTLAGFPITADGQFGPTTEQALRAWETAAGRPVDGVVDADDAAALLAMLTAGTPLTPTADPHADSDADAGPAGHHGDDQLGRPRDRRRPARRFASSGSSPPPTTSRRCPTASAVATDASPTRPTTARARSASPCTAPSCSAARSTRPRLESYGAPGKGRWVTIYANRGHTYMVVEGLRFDTSGATDAGTRWQTTTRSSSGYVIRHPVGL